MRRACIDSPTGLMLGIMADGLPVALCATRQSKLVNRLQGWAVFLLDISGNPQCKQGHCTQYP